MSLSLEKAKAKKLRDSTWWKNLIHTKPSCYYCQRPMQSFEVTMDHIVPLSRGGKSSKGNIVACCKECNSEKKYMTAGEFLLKKNS